jgi:hypothetical protein
MTDGKNRLVNGNYSASPNVRQVTTVAESSSSSSSSSSGFSPSGAASQVVAPSVDVFSKVANDVSVTSSVTNVAEQGNSYIIEFTCKVHVPAKEGALPLQLTIGIDSNRR